MSRPSDHPSVPEDVWQVTLNVVSAYFDILRAGILYWNGMTQANLDLVGPFLKAVTYFWEAEKNNLSRTSPEQTVRDYYQLLRENILLTQSTLVAAQSQLVDYHTRELRELALSCFDTLSHPNDRGVHRYAAQLADALQGLVVDLPQAIQDVENEFGFHFEEDTYTRIAHTDRMDLYQVLPTEPGVEVRNDIKPILIIHPYVLGHNILAFLPKARRSYVHSFANHGIPTYVRIVKQIDTTPAVQIMTGEDDVSDTRVFARIIKEKHRKPVTLNGVCQGGYLAVLSVLTGELDGLVDALIPCVSPIDGTLSRGLEEYLEHFAPRFRTLAYSTKTLPNGNRVVDASVMSWVYKLKSLRYEAPLDFYRRLETFQESVRSGRSAVTKTTAAVLRWLLLDRTDLPVEVTRLSSLSYATPISSDGELPAQLFGRRLNLRRIQEKGIKVHLCYGAQDLLVEPPSSLILTKFVDAEVAEFPKGHGAIMTSWSYPGSEYALDKDLPNGQRGPVKFHLDLDKAQSAGPRTEPSGQ